MEADGLVTPTRHDRLSSLDCGKGAAPLLVVITLPCRTPGVARCCRTRTAVFRGLLHIGFMGRSRAWGEVSDRKSLYDPIVPALIDALPGELYQKIGEDGARRAKLWLDSTTRTMSTWSVYDRFGVARLLYPWPEGGKAYSYDLGGLFFGGDLHQQSFLVECKKYSNDNQGEHFDKFLAQSYVTLKTYPQLADHFLWITWHPFRVTTWNDLAKEDKIRAALLKEKSRIFGNVSDQDALAEIDPVIVTDLVDRVWVVVLSDKQETLVISREDRAEVLKLRALQGEQ